MPTRVLRRSPASEKAANYGYGDLLQDSLALVGKKATGNVARMTSGGLSDEELLEIGLAPAGGMLKVAGTSKLLAGLLAREAQTIAASRKYQPNAPKYILEESLGRMRGTRQLFRETLKVPEAEYKRIKDIDWGTGGKGELGSYNPMTRRILLHPKLEGLDVVWHEFGHGRQWAGELEAMPEMGITEMEASGALIGFWKHLIEATKGKMTTEEFYQTVSPIERHARAFAEKMVFSAPRKFGKVYKETLAKELKTSEHSLESLWGREAVRSVWEEALLKPVREFD